MKVPEQKVKKIKKQTKVVEGMGNNQLDPLATMKVAVLTEGSHS